MSIDGYTRGIPTYKGKDGKTYGHLVETKENCITDDNGVSLTDKLANIVSGGGGVSSEELDNILNGTTPVGNANKLGGKGASEYALSKNFFAGDTYSYMQSEPTISQDGYTYRLLAGNMGLKILRTNNNWETYETFLDLANYLPNVGGTVTGNVSLYNPNNDIGLFVHNGIHDINIATTTYGSAGIYSPTLQQWILVSNANGTNTFNGTASGNLPLSGGEITGTNDNPLSIDGKGQAFIRFLTDGVGNGYFGVDANGKLITNIGGYGWADILHTGNRLEFIGSASGLGKAIAYDTNVYKELYCELAYFGSAKVSFDIVIPNGGTYNSGHQTSTGVTGGSVYLTGNTIQTSNFYFEGISRSDDNITLTVYGKR